MVLVRTFISKSDGVQLSLDQDVTVFCHIICLQIKKKQPTLMFIVDIATTREWRQLLLDIVTEC